MKRDNQEKDIGFSIVVPCYNEEKNIPILVHRFREAISSNNIKIVLVNNGSTDESENIIKDLENQNDFLMSVNIPKNIGYGHGIITGLKACDTEFIGWTHADLQCKPEDVMKAIKVIEENNYNQKLYVKGLRRGRPLMDTFFTLGMSIFETFYFQKILFDINAQPNIFSKKFFQNWINPPDDFSLDLYSLYLAKINNISIRRFNVTFPPRIHGESKWNTGFQSKIKFIKRTLSYSVNLKKDLRR